VLSGMSTKSARLGAKLWLVPGSPPSAPMPAVPALDDSELLAALGRGDPSAATALHDRLRPQVDRTVRRLLGSSDPDLCDVEQQAMIEVVLTVATYRGDCSLDSWTSAVAAHVVYKHIRRRKVERRIFGRLDADLFLEVRSPSRTGHEALVRSMLRRVLAHLDAVDEVKAWAFVLHDVCGYDLREIARITGVSAAAAQTRLIRGRREVHERIAGDPELANLLESIGGSR
jgi:RNA polymerase sigma-70 factor, ECF subfamily